MKREKGFTLVELLSVVVILGVTFMFVLPKLVGLINDGEDKETKLIEERVLSAAKDYVNDIDGSFYKSLKNEGDTSYIYKTDLLDAGLLNEEEASKLNTWAGVKGKLLSNDKIEYTVEYIDAEPKEYTNEELYLMIQNMGGGSSSGGTGSGGNVDSSAIDDLQGQINDLSDKNNSNNMFLKTYPVGSIYVSTSNTNPGTTFGGTWESFGAGRTLVGVDASQTEFATVEKTGGSKNLQAHNHNLSVTTETTELGGSVNFHGSELGGLIYTATGIFSLNNTQANKYYSVSSISSSSGAVSSGNVVIDASHDHTITGNTENAGTGDSGNLMPYITVYMWKRTA